MATRTLGQLEAAIEAHLPQALQQARQRPAYHEVGAAMREIRDRKLWKAAGHHTWASYCQTRWHLTVNACNQFVEMAQIAEGMVAAGLPRPSEWEAKMRAGGKKTAGSGRRPVLYSADDQDGDEPEDSQPAPRKIGTIKGRPEPRPKRSANAAAAEVKDLIDRLEYLHREHPRAEDAAKALAYYTRIVLPWPGAKVTEREAAAC